MVKSEVVMCEAFYSQLLFGASASNTNPNPLTQLGLDSFEVIILILIHLTPMEPEYYILILINITPLEPQ